MKRYLIDGILRLDPFENEFETLDHLDEQQIAGGNHSIGIKLSKFMLSK